MGKNYRPQVVSTLEAATRKNAELRLMKVSYLLYNTDVASKFYFYY